MQNPIQVIKGDDGVYIVTYFGKTVGWIQPATFLQVGRRKCYRALTIHDDLKHLPSVKSATEWLIANYH